MSKVYNIGVFVGSLRNASYSRKLANTFKKIAPAGLNLEIIEIGDMPMYNEDLETDVPPASWSTFRHAVKHVDGFLFITPEYNRSVPAVLKNAIDVGSRPYGQSVWNGKPGAVVSLSQGIIGGFGANHHLRQCLVFNDVQTMQQPEAYLSHIQNIITDSAEPANESSHAFLVSILTAFEALVKKFD
ncbi:NADPH-dependent FMN reductase [Bartonella sp. HY038]|uniref:NADPH-dependent FMN reductase n=1 Tax=Bartonella sp. HY038 TaxID=2759660 RepID=UPI0015F81DF2|nr:NAD(P)H-dependent oxidoreductase [Bartonella sp. HY038]